MDHTLMNDGVLEALAFKLGNEEYGIKIMVGHRLMQATPDSVTVQTQDGEQKVHIPSWGTGWGVRVLNRLIADNYEK